MPDAATTSRVKGNAQSDIAINKNLQIDVAVDNPTPAAGEKIRYTVTLKNTSDAPIRNLFLWADREQKQGGNVAGEGMHCFAADDPRPVVACFPKPNEFFNLEKAGTPGDTQKISYTLTPSDASVCGSPITGSVQIHQRQTATASKKSLILAEQPLQSVTPACGSLEIRYSSEGDADSTQKKYVVSITNNGKAAVENIFVWADRTPLQGDKVKGEGAYCFPSTFEKRSFVACFQELNKGFRISPGQTRTFAYTIDEKLDPAFCGKTVQATAEAHQRRTLAEEESTGNKSAVLARSSPLDSISQCPNVSVHVWADNIRPTIGGTVRYQVSLKNNGTQYLENLFFWADRPEALGSKVASPGNYCFAADAPGPVVACFENTEHISLAPGEEKAVSYTIDLKSDPSLCGKPISVAAELRHYTKGQSPSLTPVLSKSSPAVITPVCESLSITYVADTTTPTLGGEVQYTMTVQNNGKSALSDLVVRADRTPVQQFSLVSNFLSEGCTAQANTVICADKDGLPFTLEAGQAKRFSYRVSLQKEASFCSVPYKGYAVVARKNSTAALATSPAVELTPKCDGEPNIEYKVTDPNPAIGGMAEYVITVTNNGTTPLKNLFAWGDVTQAHGKKVTVSEYANWHCALSDSSIYVLCGEKNAQGSAGSAPGAFSLKPGESKYFRYSVDIPDDEALCRYGSKGKAFLTSVESPSSSQTLVTSAEVEIAPSCPQISLQYAVDNTKPPIGGEVTYTMTMTNNGTAAVSNLMFESSLGKPFESTVRAVEDTCSYYYADSSVRCPSYRPQDGFTLEPGQSRRVKFRAILKKDPSLCNVPVSTVATARKIEARLAESEPLEIIPQCGLLLELGGTNPLMFKNLENPEFPNLLTLTGFGNDFLQMKVRLTNTMATRQETDTSVIVQLPSVLVGQAIDKRCTVLPKNQLRCIFGPLSPKEKQTLEFTAWRTKPALGCNLTLPARAQAEAQSNLVANANIRTTCIDPCSDGKDNENDGKIDAKDPGCIGKNGVYNPFGASEEESVCVPLFPNDVNRGGDTVNFVFAPMATIAPFLRGNAQSQARYLERFEPFASMKGKLQFWYLPGGVKAPPVQTEVDKEVPGSLSCHCEVPANCPGLGQAHYVYICSVACRANANFSGNMRLSSNDDAGTFAHEAGHTFGLSDEYTERGRGDRPGNRNCVNTRQEAQTMWGALMGQRGTGMYSGCSYTEDNFRSQYNSMMRHHYESGPPGGFGPVNERHIRKVLMNFSGLASNNDNSVVIGSVWSFMAAQLATEPLPETALELKLIRTENGAYTVAEQKVVSMPFGVKPTHEQGNVVRVKVGDTTYTQTFAGSDTNIVENFGTGSISLVSYQETPRAFVTVHVGLGNTVGSGEILLAADGEEVVPEVWVSACSNTDADVTNDCPEDMYRGETVTVPDSDRWYTDWLSWLFIIGSVASLGIVHWLLQHFVRHGAVASKEGETR